MKLLLTVLFTIFSYVVEAQTYVISYRFTVNQGKLVYKVADTLELSAMPVIVKDQVNFEYHGGYYYFKIAKMLHEKKVRGYYNSHVTPEIFYGLCTFMSNPYSIRISTYSDCPGCSLGKLPTTLWIIPMLFNRKSNIENLRAFVFTNDPHIIKQIRSGKQAAAAWLTISAR